MTKTHKNKPKGNLKLNQKLLTYIRVRITVHNCRTQYNRTVLIIFRLILRTITIAEMLSTGLDGYLIFIHNG